MIYSISNIPIAERKNLGIIMMGFVPYLGPEPS